MEIRCPTESNTLLAVNQVTILAISDPRCPGAARFQNSWEVPKATRRSNTTKGALATAASDLRCRYLALQPVKQKQNSQNSSSLPPKRGYGSTRLSVLVGPNEYLRCRCSWRGKNPQEHQQILTRKETISSVVTDAGSLCCRRFIHTTEELEQAKDAA